MAKDDPPHPDQVKVHKGRINIGKEFQCTALPRCKKDASTYKDKEAVVLYWNSNFDSPQVPGFIAWAQSASLPGPKRTVEQILTVLTQFRGDVQVM